ncbi:hypothetical protein HPB52_003415 [Rhipicephalus sanguineus]|uniref:DUF7041 domain-containing protein n=1 Tax=Rhipicephalus sanguineus TaxID=34632 RepID=A0A9D4SVK2_RHISA|nr:hypothetical protein HPB52_003415 [Rhipicephalus sanguineus]
MGSHARALSKVVFFTSGAWRDVKSETILHCFEKAGFSRGSSAAKEITAEADIDAAAADGAAAVTSFRQLWEAVGDASLVPSGLDYLDFALADQDLVAMEELTTDELTTSVSEKGMASSSDGEGDDIGAPQPGTAGAALAAVDTLPHRAAHPEIPELERKSEYDHLAFRELVCQIFNLDGAKPARTPPPPSTKRTLHKPEKAKSYLAEFVVPQVSHHPPMLAQHCEGRGWRCWQEFSMSSKFRGKYLQLVTTDASHIATMRPAASLRRHGTKSQENSTPSVATLKLQSDGEPWFIHIEAQFRHHHITSQMAKYDHAGSALSPTTTALARNVLLAPPPEDPYDTLKQELLRGSEADDAVWQVVPLGVVHLELVRGGHFTWHKVTTVVHNIIVGKLWVDHQGDMEIRNHQQGHVARLKFQPYSYFSREPPRRVTGFVSDPDGNPIWVLQGTWDSQMEYARVISTTGSQGSRPVIESASPRLVWKRRLPGEEYERMYNFTVLACQLNEPDDSVAPTDSRRRPDQRLMEEGNWDEANQRQYCR